MAYRLDVHKNQANLRQEYALYWNGEPFSLEILEWKSWGVMNSGLLNIEVSQVEMRFGEVWIHS